MTRPNPADSPEQLASAASLLSATVDALGKKLDVSERQIKQTERQLRRNKIVNKVLGAMIAAIIFVIIGLIYVDVQLNHSNKHQKSEIACITDWANKITDRTTALGDLANNRTNALDQLIREIVDPSHQTKADFQKAIKIYLDASNAYNQGLLKNPIPPKPTFRCN